MTIASEITRLQGAKANIQTSIGNKGVTVPSSAKLNEYAGYIDQIQTGVPQEDFNIVEAASTGVTIGYPELDYRSDYYPALMGDGLMCSVGNYIFMVGSYGYTKNFGTYTRVERNIGIYYKEIGATNWNFCSLNGWFDERNTPPNGMAIDGVYISSDGSINIHQSLLYYGTEKFSFYYNWVLGSDTITDSTLREGDSLENYKTHNCETFSRAISTNDIEAIGFKITSSLL